MLSKKLMADKSILSALALSVMLAACGGGSSSKSEPTPPPAPPAPPEVTYSYEVSVTNLTNAQPFSPVAVILHDEGRIFSLGEKASVALEELSEAGTNGKLLAESFVKAGVSGSGEVLPGKSQTITVSIKNKKPKFLSSATMLVNTNDAFTGVNALAIENLAVGESISLRASSYDSGTEKNSETKDTIPGPAGGGQGFNAERDDVDFVGMHQGVVSKDDGLAQSVLTEAHRFDNPTIAIAVKRTK